MNVQNQPSPSTLANKLITKKRKIIKLTFQQSWYAEFNWLHWDPTLEKLLCYHCLRYYKLNVRKHGHIQNNVTSTGFYNLSKFKEKCMDHSTSSLHKDAMNYFMKSEQNVESVITNVKHKDSKENYLILVTLFYSIKYLARQGISHRVKNLN